MIIEDYDNQPTLITYFTTAQHSVNIIHPDRSNQP